MKNIIIVVLVVAAISVLGYGLFLSSRKSVDSALTPAGQTGADLIPDLVLKDYNGKPMVLTQFKGKSVIVNSWASWCPFCREELKDFAEIKKEFGDRVQIIAIDRAESLAVAKSYSDELGVSGELVFLLDPADSFYQSIGGFSMPETIFADEDGEIRIHKRGPMKASEIREKLESILQKFEL